MSGQIDEYGIQVLLEQQTEQAVAELLPRLAAVGDHLVAKIKQAAPKKSGKLAQQIDCRVDRQRLAVVIRSNAYYSAWLELGFKHKGGYRKKSETTTNVQKTFFAKTVEAEMPVIERILQGD